MLVPCLCFYLRYWAQNLILVVSVARNLVDWLILLKLLSVYIKSQYFHYIQTKNGHSFITVSEMTNF